MFHHGSSRLKGPLTKGRAWRASAARAAGRSRAEPPGPATVGNVQGPDSGLKEQDGSPIRTELVERVRREIAEGTYETPEKMEAALQRLFEQLEDKE